jgi:hypothetical protein
MPPNSVARVVPASVLLQIAEALDVAQEEIAALKRQVAERDEHIRELQEMLGRAT